LRGVTLKGRYDDLPNMLFFPEMCDNVENWIPFFSDPNNRVHLVVIRLLTIEMYTSLILVTLETQIGLIPLTLKKWLMMLSDTCTTIKLLWRLWQGMVLELKLLWQLDVIILKELQESIV